MSGILYWCKKYTFCICVENHLKKLWTPGKTKNPNPRILTIKPNSEAFRAHFDQVQEQLETLASMDDLLSGQYNACITMTLCVIVILLNRHVKQVQRTGAEGCFCSSLSF